MDIKGDLAQILSGMPIIVPNCNIAITQPTVKDICAFGEDDFLTAVQIIVNVEKFVGELRQGNPQLEMLSDFHLLMMALSQDISIKSLISEFFNIIFPNYKVIIERNLINFKIEEVKKNIGQLNPMNFEEFQFYLKKLFLPIGIDGDDPDYNPANEQARQIAEKLKKGNEIRNKLNQEKNSGQVSQSLIGSYTSILSVGMGMDINIFYNYTLFQLYDSFLRYTTKIQYDFYMRVSTMPMMDTSEMKEPNNWLDDLYK